jgi:RNA polymerase sigma-70 factor (ECF subfamily)
LGVIWLSDKSLVQKVLRGETEAYDLLVRRWEKKLFNFAYRLTGDREDALDIAQESFTRAFEQIQRLKDTEKFPHWLFRIARNCWISHFRSNQLASTEPLANESEEGPSIEELLTEHVTVLVDSGQRFELHELRLALAKALATLPTEQRETVVLKVFEGMKFSEIAEIVECPVSTVKSRLYLGLNQLKKILTERPRGKT